MSGIEDWLPGGQHAFFGVDRSIPAALARKSPSGRIEGARRWLGYKLYAVVYWLLRGHA